MEHPGKRILAVDYGSRRIGLAVSDPLGITAQPLRAIERKGDRADLEAIGRVLREVDAGEVLLGLPISLDGTEGPAARKAREFGEKIRATLTVPVTPWDERMTTVQAERTLIEAGVRRARRREVRDSLSAVFLLQNALDYRNRKTGG